MSMAHHGTTRAFNRLNYVSFTLRSLDMIDRWLHRVVMDTNDSIPFNHPSLQVSSADGMFMIPINVRSKQ